MLNSKSTTETFRSRYLEISRLKMLSLEKIHLLTFQLDSESCRAEIHGSRRWTQVMGVDGGFAHCRYGLGIFLAPCGLPPNTLCSE